MLTLLLIVHGLIAVALLGAITHQVFSAFRASGTKGNNLVAKFAGVSAPIYSSTVVILFILSNVGGALLYPHYRLEVRPTLEDLGLRAANGVFEIKEHFAAIGLGLLPAYWLYWKTPLNPEMRFGRRYITVILAFFVWWNFLVGHVLNNIKGIFE